MNIISAKSNSMSSGIRWSALGEYSTEGVIFVVYVILARLLAPRDFGLLAMAMVFVGMTDMFSRLGTNTIVIQQKQLTQELLSSLFFLNLAAGIIVGGVFFLLSPLFGLLIDNPHVTLILRVLSITFVTSSIGSVHNGLLRRKLLFNRLALVQLSAALSKGVVAIYLAMAGYEVWALVIAILVSDLVRTALLFFATAWLPRLRMDWHEIKRVKAFMFNITGFGLFNSLSTRAGNFIIGRFLGATLLGYYSLAYRLQTLPNQYVSHVVGRVLLSSLSAAQDDDALFRRRYLRACAGVALITVPISVGMALVAEPFVLTVYGEKWREAIPVIAILSLVGSMHSIAVLSGNIFIAKGETGLWLKWGAASGIISALSLIGGLPWGLVGVTGACAISTLALAYLSFIISFRLFGLRLSELFAALRPYLGATAIMGLVVIVLRGALDRLALPPALVLLCCAGAGFLIYCLCMFKICPPAFIDFIDILPGTFFSRLRFKFISR